MTQNVKLPLYVPPAAFKYPVLSKLVSRLRIPVRAGVYKLKTAGGSEERMMRLRQTVTALLKYERIELNYYRADVSQGYCERLISDAIRYGPESVDMMDMADYWLLEKQLVHKLFKVLVPRFQTCSTAYTKLYKAPNWYYSDGFHPELNKCPYDREINEPDTTHRQVSYPKAVLELKGHPFPPFLPSSTKNPSLLHNVLLSAAKADHYSRHKREVNTSMPVEDEELPSDVNDQNVSMKNTSTVSSITT